MAYTLTDCGTIYDYANSYKGAFYLSPFVPNSTVLIMQMMRPALSVRLGMPSRVSFTSQAGGTYKSRKHSTVQAKDSLAAGLCKFFAALFTQWN